MLKLAGDHLESSHKGQTEDGSGLARRVAVDMGEGALPWVYVASTVGGFLMNWRLGGRGRQAGKIITRCVRQIKVTVSKDLYEGWAL